MKVASNVGAAQDAVSGFARVHADLGGQHASPGSSTVPSIPDGVHLADQLLKRISGLVDGVKRQADNVTALATAIEDRDKRDAGGWSDKR